MAPKKKKPAPKPPRRFVHFETTIPVIRPCRRCGVWFAAGVAEGQKAEVEFVALDLGQQVWATLNGIKLYWVWRTGLVYLDASRLSGPPKGGVYPQHRCDVRWPIPPPKSVVRFRSDPNEQPPF